MTRRVRLAHSARTVRSPLAAARTHVCDVLASAPLSRTLCLPPHPPHQPPPDLTLPHKPHRLIQRPIRSFLRIPHLRYSPRTASPASTRDPTHRAARAPQ